MLVLNERVSRASSFEILATPDPAVPHRILDQFSNLNLSPSRFTVRRATARTTAIHLGFEGLDAARARRIAARLRRIVGVKSVELSLSIHPQALAETKPAPTLVGDADSAARNGAEVLLDTLADLGVDTIFGYPGGAALPIYDALFKQTRIRHILVRHEQAAAHAAEGYARSANRIGVLLVTSGPGLTNTITGLMDALMDSIPVLCISGQVATKYLGTDAFQEAPTTALTRPCTKYNCLVDHPDDITSAVRRGFAIAGSGRPGPVVLDIPKDVQLARVTPGSMSALEPDVEMIFGTSAPDVNLIREAALAISRAERPILYVGGGVINSGPEAARLLRLFAHMCGAPVTTTLMGLGAYPSRDPQSLGMLGMHGTFEANLAMRHCDVMVAIGARFDDRVTMRLDGFSPDSMKIHIDVDASSIGKTVAADIGIVGDAAEVLEGLVAEFRRFSDTRERVKPWWRQIDGWRAKRCLAFEPHADEILPQQAIRRLWEMTRGRNPIVSTEVGQHQMWAAQHFGFEDPNRWLTSGGLGTMGYGLPAAIGAQIANPDALVIDIAGEASIQMNIQELATAVQYRLPVKVFIINNRYMGMVRQWQEMIHGGRYSQTYSESLPDFVKLAEAYGATGLRCKSPRELDAVITQMVCTPGPVVVDCAVAQLVNCYPMIPSGAAHDEMVLGPKTAPAPRTP